MRRYRHLFYSLLLLPASLVAGPLFDAHLHYNADDAKRYTPQQVVDKLDHNNIRYAVITGTPASHTARLYQHAPERIVPLLGIYRGHDDKASWPADTTLPARIEEQLKQGNWYGLGELHIFARDRHSPVFRRLVGIAVKHKLPLQIHGDPAVIDSVYDIAPRQPVIWAHAGTYPYPDLLADYLQRYPTLYIDVSVRDERIAPNGTLRDDWYELFVRFPDRIMIGVDTYSTSRWDDFDTVVATIRKWLAQLPSDVARRLGHDNAAAFFKKAAKSQ